MYRYAALILFLSCGIVHGIQVNVTNSEGKLCLYADLMVNFSVSYETTDNKNETAVFTLPSNASSSGSVCNNNSSTLKLTFGNGHSWSMNFSLIGQTYQADTIVFIYNLTDGSLFTNASGIENSTVKHLITEIGLNTCYSCKSNDIIEDKSVNQTLWNVLIQAFVANGTKSDNVTSCAADVPITTPSTPTSTAAPTPSTTTAPTPTLPTPTTGNYNLTTSVNGSVCLLASFGLRIGVKQAEKYEEMNLDPAATNVSGSCGVNSSELTLVSSNMKIMFTFANDSKKFHLQGLNVTGKTSSGVQFDESNTNLSMWQASLSSSYMCNKEQNCSINGNLSIFTFNLRVQPFAVKDGVFNTAEDCQPESFLVPIAVGIALLVLILIVVLAYFIGRRRNMAAGYQSF